MKILLAIFILTGVVFTVKCEDTNDEANFEEPCKNADDVTNCVRRYLGEIALCNVVDQPSKDKTIYFKGKHNAYVPKINLTMGLTETYLSKLDGSIERFYKNQKTNNLVMSVEFKGAHLDSKAVHFIISQRSKEPKVVIERAYGTYPVILTAVIPAKHKISAKTIRESMITAFLPVGNVAFTIGPKITKSRDPVVSSMVQGLVADVPTVLQELFLTGATDFFIAYLQSYICNFGISYENLE